MEIRELDASTDDQLRAYAHRAGILGADTMARGELLAELVSAGGAMTRSEQRLVAGTEVYETGHARVRKYVVTEDVQITVRVRREELRVEREPVPDAQRSAVEDPDVFGPDERFGGPGGGEVFTITLHEERPLVTTEIVPVERVRLVKYVETDRRTVSGNVQKERIEVLLPGQSPTTLG